MLQSPFNPSRTAKIDTKDGVSCPNFQQRFCMYRPITNERENVHSKFLLMKSSKKKHFIFSSACYLTIWLMILPNFFEKKGILKNMPAGFPPKCQN